jgi:hypothetical protein
MREQLQNYSKDMTTAIVCKDEHRKAEIAGIRERYQKKNMSKRKQEVKSMTKCIRGKKVAFFY